METTVTTHELEAQYMAALKAIPGTFGPTARVRDLGRELFAAHTADLFSSHPQVAALDVRAEGGPAVIDRVELTDGTTFAMEVDKSDRDEDTGAALDGLDDQRKVVADWAQRANLGRFVMAMGDREARMAVRVTPDRVQTIARVK